MSFFLAEQGEVWGMGKALSDYSSGVSTMLPSKRLEAVKSIAPKAAYGGGILYVKPDFTLWGLGPALTWITGNSSVNTTTPVKLADDVKLA